MSNKTIKCNSCGFPLDAASASQNRIKCPKCGSVNVIETAKSLSDSDNESGDVVGGVPVTVGGAAIHRSIVSWILQKHAIMPPDVFEELRLTSVERFCVPCYLFECNATIRYSYEVGNQRERVRRIGDDDDYTERYTEYTHHNDAYEFSACVLVAENDQFAKPIQSLYENLTLSDVVDLESLKYPSDVKQQSSNVTFPKAQEEVKTIVGNRAQEGIKKILERTDHKDLQIRNDYHVEYDSTPKRILAPLIHVTFSYKDKTGDFWLTGDATRVQADNPPVDISYNQQINQYASKTHLSFSCCLPFALGLLCVLLGIVLFFDPTATSSESLCALLIGGLLLGLGGFLTYRTDSSVKKAQAALEKFIQEHNNIYAQFIKGKIPLRGIWEKSLRGKPEAFPENVIRTQLNITSIGPRKADVVNIVHNSTNMDHKQIEERIKLRLIGAVITITCGSDAEADRIQKELESVGATVTRTYLLP